MIKKYVISIFVFVSMISCASKKDILYLQDVDDHSNEIILYTSAKIQPNDVLKITIGSLNPESSIPYNKISRTSGGISVEMMQLEGYLVSEDLTISFPILGKLSVKNKTTQEFSNYLKALLEDGGHLKNPTVDVRLINAKVTILGEVKQPGTFNFTEQNITLLQALGLAGDLTINGKREDVILIRNEEGVRKISHIDLTKGDWLTGPFSFIKPNDVIIVNPNGPKVKSAGFVGNTATVLSVVSILLTTVVLITR